QIGAGRLVHPTQVAQRVLGVRDRVRCEDHVADEVSHLARIVKQLLRGGGNPALVESDVVQAVLHTSHARQAHEGDCEQQNEQGAESDTQAGADAIASKKIHRSLSKWGSAGAAEALTCMYVAPPSRPGVTADSRATGAPDYKNVTHVRQRVGLPFKKRARRLRRAPRLPAMCGGSELLPVLVGAGSRRRARH